MMLRIRIWLALTLIGLVGGPAVSWAVARPPVKRPNIVLIVADDLGFADLGAFGGEIDTPNLDALANAGLRLTGFHAAPTCSPTRAMLMSGTDNHTAGVGAMAELPIPGREDRWGYEGAITARVATLAERLRAGGYQTLMSGKWHLGLAPESSPAARGFDHSFALLQGGANHFGGAGFAPGSPSPYMAASYVEDGRPVAVAADFYSSDAYTARLIAMLDATRSGQPFFAYLAFTAPHSPLQAPPALIEKYHGHYDQGWDALRRQRLQKMQQLGILPAGTAARELVPDPQAWTKLSPDQRRIESRKMEVYAAMVERLDWNVGRLIAYLKSTNRYDGTIFIFMSDNGPAAETAQTFAMIPGVVEHANAADNSLGNMGSGSSFIFYGPYWAQAGSVPSRLYKGAMTEGGTRVPAFITYAHFRRQHAIGGAFATVMDILPTVLAAAGVPVSAQVGGRSVAPVRGRSMLPYLLAQADGVHPAREPMPLELHGQAVVRQGDWKLLRMPQPFGDGNWALYNVSDDPAERLDLSGSEARRREAMIATWNRFAGDVQVLGH
jgi:arylsulfatase